jgi:hypothetical protein
MESPRVGLITAKEALDVSITGRGTIDGRGYLFVDDQRWKTEPDLDPQYPRQGADFMNPRHGTQHGPWEVKPEGRPGDMIRFYRCRNVLIRDVTICNSTTWTVHLHDCESVTVENACIHSRGSGWRVPNDDGIDLRFCKQVRIANCDIHTGDDCIAVFGSQQVTVTNCILRSRSAGIRVGYDQGDARDCVFGNLVIEANRGLLLNVRAGATVENILFHAIVLRTHLITGQWWGKGEPIHISTVRMRRYTAPLGFLRNVRFRDILAEGETGILLYGCEECPIENVQLENVRLMVKASPLQASYGGNFDLREMADPSRRIFKHDIAGLFGRYVHGLEIRNFRLDWDDGLPDYFTHGIEIEHYRDLEIDGFKGGPAHPAPGAKSVAICLQDGEGAILSRCPAPE